MVAQRYAEYGRVRDAAFSATHGGHTPGGPSISTMRAAAACGPSVKGETHETRFNSRGYGEGASHGPSTILER